MFARVGRGVARTRMHKLEPRHEHATATPRQPVQPVPWPRAARDQNPRRPGAPNKTATFCSSLLPASSRARRINSSRTTAARPRALLATLLHPLPRAAEILIGLLWCSDPTQRGAAVEPHDGIRRWDGGSAAAPRAADCRSSQPQPKCERRDRLGPSPHRAEALAVSHHETSGLCRERPLPSQARRSLGRRRWGIP